MTRAGGGGAWALVVRRARAGDAPARAALLREVYDEYNTDAFLLFFFQEATLQGVVLAGAALFIFCGAPAAACALLPAAAAALVALAARLHHRRLANLHAQRMLKEWGGWVVEARGPAAGGPPPGAVSVRDGTGADGSDSDPPTYFSQVVGTVSVLTERGAGGLGAEGRVAALCVARGWRRRGAGGALLAAALHAARARGLLALHARVSQLQGGARSLLHARGWACRAAGHVPCAGGLLSLRVAHLVADLPHA